MTWRIAFSTSSCKPPSETTCLIRLSPAKVLDPACPTAAQAIAAEMKKYKTSEIRTAIITLYAFLQTSEKGLLKSAPKQNEMGYRSILRLTRKLSVKGKPSGSFGSHHSMPSSLLPLKVVELVHLTFSGVCRPSGRIGGGLCSTSDESILHLLAYCPIATQCWSLSNINMSSTPASSIGDWFAYNRKLLDNYHCSLMLMISWYLWTKMSFHRIKKLPA
nr:Putative ribonuclease H protein At1g65750 family [Ipomoea batatas]